MDMAFTNNLCALFLERVNWHTPKAMQSRVEMNDDYIALDCASLVCRELGIEARLRKIKRSQKEKGGEHKNGTKPRDTANKRKS